MKAETYFTRAIEADPEYGSSYAHRARVSGVVLVDRVPFAALVAFPAVLHRGAPSSIRSREVAFGIPSIELTLQTLRFG